MKKKKKKKLKIARIPPEILKNYVSCLSVRFWWGSLVFWTRNAIRTDNARWNMLQSCFWVLGERWSLKHREEMNDLLESSLQLTLTGSIRSAHGILRHTLLQHTVDWRLALSIFFPLQVTRNTGTGTEGSIELSASNTEKSNSREGKWYRFMHLGQNPLFSRTLSKVLTALLHFKMPMAIASKFRRKPKLISDWLSGCPMCHLLGHILRIKTAYSTHIFADMKVWKTSALPLEISICGSWRSNSHSQATFFVNPFTDVHPP